MPVYNIPNNIQDGDPGQISWAIGVANAINDAGIKIDEILASINGIQRVFVQQATPVYSGTGVWFVLDGSNNLTDIRIQVA